MSIAGGGRLASALLVLALCGCPERSDDAAHLYNTFAIRDAVRNGTSLSGIDPRNAITLRGQPIPLLSPPYQDTAVLQQSSVDGLSVTPAFLEGQPAAYVTTEVWYDYAPIWTQPLYVIVTAWDEKAPFSHFLKGSLPVFGVGVDSSFYSPYWQIYYAVAPADSKPDAFQSVKDIFDAHLEIHEGTNKLCPIVPPDVDVAAGDQAAPVRPFDQEPLGNIKHTQAWVDGTKVSVLDFGNDRFIADEHGLVREDALFHFATRGPNGDLREVGLPSVGGVGPLRSGLAPDLRNGVPRFGTLWRIFLVEVPSSAAAFVRPGQDALRAQLAGLGVNAPTPAPEVAARADVGAYELRVAGDPSCFTDAGQFPDGCQWLDSQSAIESNLPQSAVHRTDFAVTCPIINYLGKPVPNQ